MKLSASHANGVRICWNRPSQSNCFDKAHNTFLISEYYSVGKNIDYYILKSESGEFLSDDYKEYYDNTKYLKHGYTSGVFTDKANYRIGYWFGNI